MFFSFKALGFGFGFGGGRELAVQRREDCVCVCVFGSWKESNRTFGFGSFFSARGELFSWSHKCWYVKC